MIEGWAEETYFILFDTIEIEQLTEAYCLAEFLPGYRLVGLRNWDDVIVADDNGSIFTVPTVPTVAQYLEPCSLPDISDLQHDEGVAGQIKWYITPIIFGGDPKLGENVTWVPISKHAELVKWWNQRFQEANGRD
jgi:hypothetical protein